MDMSSRLLLAGAPSVDIIRGYFSTSVDLARANLLIPSALRFQLGNQRVVVLPSALNHTGAMRLQPHRHARTGSVHWSVQV